MKHIKNDLKIHTCSRVRIRLGLNTKKNTQIALKINKTKHQKSKKK